MSFRRGQPEQRDPAEDAQLVARQFHEHHEKFFAHGKGRDPLPWSNMPASYHRRLILTFELMLRGGVLTPGPGAALHGQPEE